MGAQQKHQCLKCNLLFTLLTNAVTITCPNCGSKNTQPIKDVEPINEDGRTGKRVLTG